MDAKFPIYMIELDPEGSITSGIQAVALVDYPAYKTNFMAFNEAKEFKFEVVDEEKQIITGPLMIPDKLVYREDEKGQPFYVAAGKDVIFNLSQKFAAEGRNSLIKETHDAAGASNGIFIFESFVTDDKRVPTVVGFEDMPTGTWFITCKVNNPAIWQEVKAGTFKGFSLEANFPTRLVTTAPQEFVDANFTDAEIEALKKIF